MNTSKQPLIHLQNVCLFDSLLLFEFILFFCEATALSMERSS